jgi:molybdopterin/thiamine biosynthesis adenylyltransferase
MTQDLARYARQMLLPGIGEAGQRRLLQSRAAVIGCGATGTVLASHLARAGVGFIRLVDRDWVEWTNLPRQVLYDEDDARAAAPKAPAAAEHLRRVNSDITLEPVVADVHAGNVEALIGDTDLVLDGSDNFEARYILNDACVRAGRPWVYTGAVATHGMTLLIRPGETACLRCAFPDPPPAGSTATCDTAGVLGPAVGLIASLAAAEALKLLVGVPEALAEGLVQVDVWDLTWRHLRLARDPDCPCCARREFPYLEVGAGSLATRLCGREAVQITPLPPAALDLDAMAGRLREVGSVTVNPFLLKFTADGRQITLFADGRAVIQGTTDEAVARSLYARYVGL